MFCGPFKCPRGGRITRYVARRRIDVRFANKVAGTKRPRSIRRAIIHALVAVGPLASALTILAVAGKLASVPAESRHFGRRAALRVGAGLVPRGEVGIIVVITAFSAGPIDGDLYTALIVMAIATSVIGPVLRQRLFRDAPSAAAGPPAEPEATGV